MKIHALVCTYNSVENIEACLRSLVGLVDDVTIFDGRWLGVEGDSVHSTDGTVEKILAVAKELKPFPIYLMATFEPMNQVDARNELIKMVPQDEWFIVVDSDEVILRWDNVRETLETTDKIGFRIRLCGSNKEFKGIPIPNPRFMKKMKNVQYTRNHRYMKNDDGEIKAGDELPVLEITVSHEGENKAMRPVIERYKNWLLMWEQKEDGYLKDYQDWLREDQKLKKEDKS